MAPRCRRLIPMIMASWLLPLGACGGGSAITTPGPKGIVFPTTFSFTGAVTASGNFTDTNSANTATSCADFGRNGIVGTYFIRSPPRGQKLRDQRFEYESLVQGYHGPGEYTDVHSLVTMTVGDGAFQAGEGSGLRLTSHADGSGRVLFESFTDVTDSSRHLSGRIEWTCRRAS
ncbi:MAG: hypothetical protein ABR564_00340 [Candidatus Dormibacteria bacterium]